MPDHSHLFLQATPALKDRIMVQCKRLGMTQSALIRMALVRYLEEEEKTIPRLKRS